MSSMRRPLGLKSYLAAGELPTIGLAQALIHSFARNAARPALHTPEGSLSYASLDAITDKCAAAFMRLGLKPLDRVLFQCGNNKELVFAFVGCLKAGLISVCTLAAFREQEIGYIGNHVDARAHIVQLDDPKFDLGEFALKMQGRIPTMRHIISVRGTERPGLIRLENIIATEDAKDAAEKVRALERDAFQVAVFQLSGGTTGVPKIIPRMANDYLFNMKRTSEWLGYRADDVMFMPMPMIHNACMACFLGPALLTGAAFAIPADMRPEFVGQDLSRSAADLGRPDPRASSASVGDDQGGPWLA